jgi:glucose/arabinose dehydrogenase
MRRTATAAAAVLAASLAGTAAIPAVGKAAREYPGNGDTGRPQRTRAPRANAGRPRVVPGHKPVTWARGLTSVTAIAFDHQGRLLATEFNTGGLLSPPTVPGALVRISNDGRTVTTLPVTGLYQPTGIAVSADGTVYVSNYGDSTTVASSHPGEIVKITGLS